MTWAQQAIDLANKVIDLTQSWSSIVYSDLKWVGNWLITILPQLKDIWVDITQSTISIVNDFYLRFIDYLLIINSMYLITWLFTTVVLWYIFKKVINKFNNDSDGYVFGIFFVSLAIVLVSLWNLYRIKNIVQLKTVPEVTVAKQLVDFKEFISNKK